MGYFSNGTAGMDYEAQWCERCVHQNGPDGKTGCAVWFAHMTRNYKDCNDQESILHMLIPRSKDKLSNEQCLMFCLDTDAAKDQAMREEYKRQMQLKITKTK